MVLLNPAGTTSLLYDVSDPLHPQLLCVLSNTSAHVFTGDTVAYLHPVSATETDVVLHSIGSGNESVVAKLPFASAYGAWTPDGGVAAYTTMLPPSDGAPGGSMQVWLYSAGAGRVLFSYPVAPGDCVCRFGLPPPVLTLSPDGQYLAAGWESGKGAPPLAVYRVADGHRVLTADPQYSVAFWDRTGHRLLLAGQTAAAVAGWTPEGGIVTVAHTPWSYLPSLSPDGTFGVYTAYPSADQTQPRVYLFDRRSGTARMLVAAPRSQGLFVKDGWTWYLEERPCGANEGCPGATSPSGTVYAMDLATYTEHAVSFAPAEDPLANAGAEGWLTFGGPEFWPAG